MPGVFAQLEEQYVARSSDSGFVASAGLFWGALSALIYLLSHLLAPQFRALSSVKQSEWISTTVSSVHALFAVTVACKVLRDAKVPRDACTAQETWLDACIMMSVGYFINDLIIEFASMTFLSKRKNWAIVFHHVFVASSFVLAVRYSFVTWFLAVLLLNELSTIFVNFRWYLLTLGQKNGGLYLCNGVMLIVSFFLCRVVFLPAVFYLLFEDFGCCWSVESVPTARRLAARVTRLGLNSMRFSSRPTVVCVLT